MLAPPAKKVAAIVTEYRRLSHADVIVSRLLAGYHPNGVFTPPRVRVVSLYTDQVPANDMSRDLAVKHGFTIYPTVAGALTLGGSKLAVDGVLLIGEHGEYPTNERGQKLYPRFELFERITEVFRASRRSVPVFCDKHLSYSWLKAKRMYDESRELGFAFLAGSSLPATLRQPELELPLDCSLADAVAVGFGDKDAYGFHALETLQCMVERRQGGETGVAAVQALEGGAVWEWRDSPAGRWSAPLLDAALARSKRLKPGRPEDNAKAPILFLLEYRDGFRAAVYMLDGHTEDFLFAGQLRGRAEPAATLFSMYQRELLHFDGLVYEIEELFLTGRAPYAVERTLLTTGALAFLLDSLYQRKRLATPELKIAYRAPARAWFERS
ncbi:MAG: hypothetical protein HY236_11270 [Acidobacteria bacterium]|nr:hypothetical protein [Acidobacteriota bacterium]